MQDQPISETSGDIPPATASFETVQQSELESRLPKIIRFNDLARCGDEVWIENNGSLYRLRQTKQGKLILTK